MQDVDLVLRKLKLKLVGQPYVEVILTTDDGCKRYKANEDRIILKDGKPFRKNYREIGGVKCYQVFFPKHFVDDLLWNLHGETGRHPGLIKILIAYKEK